MHKKNETPLHYAAKSNSKDMMELLISKGANAKAKDIFFLTILTLF